MPLNFSRGATTRRRRRLASHPPRAKRSAMGEHHADMVNLVSGGVSVRAPVRFAQLMTAARIPLCTDHAR